MMLALADILLSWELCEMSLLVLLGFLIFLHTNELVCICFRDMTFNTDTGRTRLQKWRVFGVETFCYVVCYTNIPYSFPWRRCVTSETQCFLPSFALPFLLP